MNFIGGALASTPDLDIVLSIDDAGAGFDMAHAQRSAGLGLASMGERVQGLHGMLSIESAPGHGTRVCAVIPLRTEQAAA